MFEDSALRQINDHGLNQEIVSEQIENFKKGFPPTKLAAAATVGNGILQLSKSEVKAKTKFYDKTSGNLDIVKFVPASGAASRMFKMLFAFMDEYDGSDQAYTKLKEDQSQGSVFEFFKRLDDFAFYRDLDEAISKGGETLAEVQLSKKYVEILTHLLTSKGLDYGNLPKGLLKFHNYGETSRTPVEEHIVEGAQYAKSGDRVQIHFTVSPEHLKKFTKHVSKVTPKYEHLFKVVLEISYSIQKPSTDTIAVDLENKPFLNDDGSLLFRPAGHGALLENLDEVEADVIFLKNIDNVVPDRLKDETITYKKVIGGLLLEMKEKIFHYLTQIDEGDFDGKEIQEFISNNLGYRSERELQPEELKTILNRPVRVCGMVKNEGEAGGGPFWVRNETGQSLQIVESAQVDLEDSKQQNIFHKSTHFNPVDVVCSVKDYKGQKFDLLQYRDPSTGFITQKSKDGRDLKAQELPGLWNGSMAKWNTIFVEVPLITFNPVKAVNDLLKDQHQ